MQRGVENRKRPWSTERPRDLYRGPCGGRRKSTTDTSQWCTESLMHHHFRRRSHANTGVENVQPIIEFGVEPVHFGRSLHAGNDAPTTREVKRSKSGGYIGHLQRVDAASHAEQLACSDRIFERFRRQNGEQLSPGGDATVGSKDALNSLTRHSKHAYGQRPPAKAHTALACGQPGEKTRKPPKSLDFGGVRVCSRLRVGPRAETS